ncbi:uncharacterized protein MYCFIDRAFT_81976 [Pseudocercospora fijiensis CIRAD86]|uniref:Uncharacterized protein n=1 Tax=Pseudocercospora fijiensis (strain CIRAD86) TaxID=383855 RepID=M2Z8C2_PSEFD|nr:uncharacterized protein MYCFIDRAFT_81976 [Pseudocercospora fijiensis CIRAD86]EME86030.1 hypothetical protein MYCFIDRAFT_81976 [Pseudocercospora fijiensis CIRAD86]
MPPKRSSTEAGLETISRTRHLTKRPRRMPNHERSSDSESSGPSSASDLESSPVASANTAATSTSSIASSTSSDSESSDESSDGSDSEDEVQDDPDAEIITIRPTTSKPSIDPARVKSYAKELQARLDDFMPRLRQANNDLAAKGSSLSMEDVTEGEQHIEMNLGLGVLEQTGDESNKSGDVAVRAEAKSPSSSDDADEASDDEANIMSRLMSAPATNGKISIQEVPTVDEH